MAVTVVDVENTVTLLDPEDKDSKYGAPYHPNNKLVCVGVKPIGKTPRVFVFDHAERQGTQKDFDELQAVLDQTTLFVAHNAKHDLAWLRECGLKYNGPVWDTMIFDYVHCKGRKVPLHLAACLTRHGIPDEKGDLFTRYSPTETDKVPLQELIEYNLNDVCIEEQLYSAQLKKSTSDEPSKFMQRSIKLCNTFLPVVTNMERSGVAIDMARLKELQAEYEQELNTLNTQLAYDVQKLTGSSAFNLGSNDDLNVILYSRSPKDKASWKSIFNIGTTIRGSVRKTNRINILPKPKFAEVVQNNMNVVYKVAPEQCKVCHGRGKIHKVKKDGALYSKPFKCTHCQGTGVFNRPLPDQVAGLKLIPNNQFVTQAGFATDSDTLEYYLEHPRTPKEAKEFLVKLLRRNKLDTWVNTFLLSIEKYTMQDGILHGSFNQCVTATGRLSSSKPNMQNQSKHDKSFKLREVFVSRFTGGGLLEVDFGQLEFRIAALLSGCEKAIAAIINGVDIHVRTRDYYHGKLYMKPPVLQPEMTRQQAKNFTFAPLYGKQTEYTDFFYAEYPGIRAWHERLMDEVIRTKESRIPSGRIFSFPDARRFKNAKGQILCSGHTQIKNYSVQGFATGDVVLLVLIYIHDRMQELGLASRLILDVHDSGVIDVHPSEYDEVIAICKEAFDKLPAMIKEWFDIECTVPLSFDMAYGKNWYDTEKL